MIAFFNMQLNAVATMKSVRKHSKTAASCTSEINFSKRNNEGEYISGPVHTIQLFRKSASTRLRIKTLLANVVYQTAKENVILYIRARFHGKGHVPVLQLTHN